MYRPEWFPKSNYNDCYDILPIVQRVVEYIRGSYHCMPEQHDLDVKALKWIKDNWKHSYNSDRAGDELFDRTVFKLIETALTMKDMSQE